MVPITLLWGTLLETFFLRKSLRQCTPETNGLLVNFLFPPTIRKMPHAWLTRCRESSELWREQLLWSRENINAHRMIMFCACSTILISLILLNRSIGSWATQIFLFQANWYFCKNNILQEKLKSKVVGTLLQESWSKWENKLVKSNGQNKQRLLWYNPMVVIAKTQRVILKLSSVLNWPNLHDSSHLNSKSSLK